MSARAGALLGFERYHHTSGAGAGGYVREKASAWTTRTFKLVRESCTGTLRSVLLKTCEEAVLKVYLSRNYLFVHHNITRSGWCD